MSKSVKDLLEAAQSIPHQGGDSGRGGDDDSQPDGQGRWGKFQQFGLKIIWPGRGKSLKATTILYGSIASEIEFNQDEELNGVISFKCETVDGPVKCTIRGRDLNRIHDQISEGKRITIRVRDNIEGVVIEPIEEEES